MAVLTGAFLRFKLSRVLRHTNGRDGSPIKNDYSFLINRNSEDDSDKQDHSDEEQEDSSKENDAIDVPKDIVDV